MTSWRWDRAHSKSSKRRISERSTRGTDRDTELAFWKKQSPRVGEILKAKRAGCGDGKSRIRQLDVCLELEVTFGVEMSQSKYSLLERGRGVRVPSIPELVALALYMDFLDSPEFQELEERLHYRILPLEKVERAEIFAMLEETRRFAFNGGDRLELLRSLYDRLLAYEAAIETE